MYCKQSLLIASIIRRNHFHVQADMSSRNALHFGNNACAVTVPMRSHVQQKVPTVRKDLGAFTSYRTCLCCCMSGHTATHLSYMMALIWWLFARDICFNRGISWEFQLRTTVWPSATTATCHTVQLRSEPSS